MKQKDVTKTFMMNSNLKKPFGLYCLYNNISAFQGLEGVAPISTCTRREVAE